MVRRTRERVEFPGLTAKPSFKVSLMGMWASRVDQVHRWLTDNRIPYNSFGPTEVWLPEEHDAVALEAFIASLPNEARKLKVNKIRCRKCGDVVESKSRHDMRWCKCMSVAVDGGLDYGRILGSDFDDLSEYHE